MIREEESARDNLLIFFILFGVAREEIFRFLVNFLLVFIQT